MRYIDPWLYFDNDSNKRYSPECDIYSLGIVLWEILNEKYETALESISNGLDFKKTLIDKNIKLKTDHFPLQ